MLPQFIRVLAGCISALLRTSARAYVELDSLEPGTERRGAKGESLIGDITLKVKHTSRHEAWLVSQMTV